MIFLYNILLKRLNLNFSLFQDFIYWLFLFAFNNLLLYDFYFDMVCHFFILNYRVNLIFFFNFKILVLCFFLFNLFFLKQIFNWLLLTIFYINNWGFGFCNFIQTLFRFIFNLFLQLNFRTIVFRFLRLYVFHKVFCSKLK